MLASYDLEPSLKCLIVLNLVANYHTICPTVSTMVVDGPILVQILKPGLTRTFLQYHQEVFMPYLLTQLNTTQRIDIIWDEYVDNSLKQSARNKRGNGPRRRVLANTPLPTNWQAFLRNSDNKKELFGFLAHQTVQYVIPNKTIVTTVKQFVLSSPTMSTNNLQPCSHEEADTRIFVHVLDAVEQGHSKVMIRTVDTDVVILAIRVFVIINKKFDRSLSELWIAFGTGKHFRYIPFHELAGQLGENALVLPIFHALTGCDTVSFFSGRGKRTAWEVWKSFPSLTDALQQLCSSPNSVLSDDSLRKIERFIILLYD